MKLCCWKTALAALPLLAGSCALLSAAHGENSRPASDEVREFEILVKDKPAGTSTVRISDADGTTRVATDVSVKLNYLVYVYRYEFHGEETWRGERLISADNRATDDGRNFSARVTIDRNGALIEADGRTSRVASVDMTTNYWRAPDLAGGTCFSLMNADRGTMHNVTIQCAGHEKVVVDRQEIECTRYRVGGEVEADLWFDRQGRVVRQKSVEDGYPTEVVLRRIRPGPARTARR